MEPQRNTCGTCSLGVPCNQIRKGAGMDRMAESGFLSCKIRQSNAEEQARYMSPNRAACDLFKQK